MLARVLLTGLLFGCIPLWPQAEYRVYNDHPRIWLEEARLRRIQRDAERDTPRWGRLAELIAQPLQLKEPAFAHALAFQASANEALGREAVDWALAAAERGFNQAGDLRQGALVFDWVQPLLSDQERALLVEALSNALEALASGADPDLSATRDGLLAAIAVSGHWPGAEGAIGGFLAHWDQSLLPAIRTGAAADRAVELQAALEICSVVRHNLERDLWRESPAIFRDVALARILSYLPEDIDTSEGRARRPSVVSADSDMETEAIVGRVAEMTLVGFDSSSRSSQFLQGWLRSDAHTLHGGYGAPYELLWLNRYLPGLSPTSGPQAAYDPIRGRLFARSGWGPDGLWLGFLDGVLYRYEAGGLVPVEPSRRAEAVAFPGFALVVPEETSRFTAQILPGNPAYGQKVYLIGLDDHKTYEIRLGKFGWREYRPSGGVIVLTHSAELDLAELDFLAGETVRIRPH